MIKHHKSDDDKMKFLNQEIVKNISNAKRMRILRKITTKEKQQVSPDGRTVKFKEGKSDGTSPQRKRLTVDESAGGDSPLKMVK